MLKYHLSTLLLAIVIVALGLGWYLSRTELDKDEIIGSWHLAGSGHAPGYSTTLEFRDDGTFNKHDDGHFFSQNFSGTYTLDRFGIITFKLLQLEELIYRESKPVMLTIICRGSIDADGMLKLEVREKKKTENILCPDTFWNNTFKKKPSLAVQ